MSEEDFEVVEMMEKYGGSFVKVLAELARRADPINLIKIKLTWPEYWMEYTEMVIKEHENKKTN